MPKRMLRARLAVLTMTIAAAPLMSSGCGPSPGAATLVEGRLRLRVPFPCGVRVKVHCSYGPRCTRSHRFKHHRYRTNDHYAVDMSRDEPGNGAGKAVVAAAPGRVLRAGWARRGWAPYGKIVYLEHEVGEGEGRVRYQTLYAHLRAVTVRKGQRVEAGDVIAKLGGSARKGLRQLGAHLHFALTRGARPGLGGGHAVKPEPLGHWRDLRSGLRLVACERPATHVASTTRTW
jgi:murein DD-endopeptidase MepM/ murein hydrolase activator NlpD